MIASAADYHRKTVYDRNRMDFHPLDWANQPDVYKRYPGRRSLALPRDANWPQATISQVLMSADLEAPASIPLETLSRCLLLAYSFTARARHPGGEFLYRSAPSAGALYPCEIYAAASFVQDLEPGLYHYSVADHSMTRLETGHLHQTIWQPYVCPVEDAWPMLTFFITAIFFRSAWKYRDRAYRYHLLDAGHLAENLALALRAHGLPARVLYEFDDREVNDMLGLDPGREACLAILTIMGRGKKPRENEPVLPKKIEGLSDASRVSSREVAYPSIQEIHALSSALPPPPDRQPESDPFALLGLRSAPPRKLSPAADRPGRTAYADAVLRRRSRRNFVRNLLSSDHWETLVGMLGASPTESDRLREQAPIVGLLSESVDGLEPGFHLVDRFSGTVSTVARGKFVANMARACLDQAWLANASLHFLFLADLAHLESLWGPRGYRYALMTAGRLGQRIYLGATALRLGCCGIGAFFDSEASTLLGLNDRSFLLYLVAAGRIKG